MNLWIYCTLKVPRWIKIKPHYSALPSNYNIKGIGKPQMLTKRKRQIKKITYRHITDFLLAMIGAKVQQNDSFETQKENNWQSKIV